MELVVVIVVVVVVVLVLLGMRVLSDPTRTRSARQEAWGITCLNNLKEIGTGERLWANDHGDRTPFQASITNGGWSGLLTKSNAGLYCWKYYANTANVLGQSPSFVVCPADERKPAATFNNNFDNTHVSYFAGVTANDFYPQSIAGGDRNLGPGLVPDADFGYSPANGQGNDVVIYTNTPVSWSLKMHSQGAAGFGHILLGDGSSQQMSSANFRQRWLINAQTETNSFGTNQFGIRLVFP